MKKLCFILSGYLLIGLICYSRLALAHVHHFNNGLKQADHKVAVLGKKRPLTELALLLEQGADIAVNEDFQERVKRQITAHYQQSANIESSYLYARTLQREHAFDSALEVLTPLLAKAPHQINARLLQANIFMVQGAYQQAKHSCLALTGYIEITVIATCVLDALSQDLAQEEEQQVKLLENYQTLTRLLANVRGQGQALTYWSKQILAEMALRLNRPLAARKHLRGISLDKAPVSLVALWGDIELALEQFPLILSKLSHLVAQVKQPPDAILLRLAIAEKNIKLKTQWQTLLAKRVKLREAKQQKEHAADIARYYLDVLPVPEKAKYWARVNYQVAKMASDRDLLLRAALAQEAKTE